MVGNSIHLQVSIDSIHLPIHLPIQNQSVSQPTTQPAIQTKPNKQTPNQTRPLRTSTKTPNHQITKTTLHLQENPPAPSSSQTTRKINKHSTQQLQSKLFRRSRSRSRRRNDFDSSLSDFDGFVASCGRVLCCWVST